jgi:hypothetical protein
MAAYGFPILFSKGEIMGELTGIIIGVSVVVLTWTVAKLNEKVDRHIKRFRRFEEALKKNATGRGFKPATNHQKQPQDVYH